MRAGARAGDCAPGDVGGCDPGPGGRPVGRCHASAQPHAVREPHGLHGPDGVREPDDVLGLLALNLSMGQWLCVPMIVAGALIWAWGRTQPKLY